MGDWLAAANCSGWALSRCIIAVRGSSDTTDPDSTRNLIPVFLSVTCKFLCQRSPEQLAAGLVSRKLAWVETAGWLTVARVRAELTVIIARFSWCRVAALARVSATLATAALLRCCWRRLREPVEHDGDELAYAGAKGSHIGRERIDGSVSIRWRVCWLRAPSRA